MPVILLCSLSEANEYMAERLFVEVWEAADEPTKTKALAMATRKINLLPFKGTKLSTNQENSFPRCYPVPIETREKYREDFYPEYCDSDVPLAVKQAVAEEALALLDRGNSQRGKLQAQGVKSFSQGGISETFVPGAGKGLLSREAKDLLRPYMAQAVSY